MNTLYPGGVKGIVSFESGEVEEDYGTYQTVFAVDASGEKHDLSGAVSDADYTIPSEFLGEWTATVRQLRQRLHPDADRWRRPHSAGHQQRGRALL